MKDVPNYFIENKIPKVRWMKIGKAYKALYYCKTFSMTISPIYVYVINEKCVVAFKDKELTHEIAMFNISDFISSGEIAVDEPPKYESRVVRCWRYGTLLELKESIKHFNAPVKEKAMKTGKVVTKKKSEKEVIVRVTISPPDPPGKYEQLTLF